jgi:uroporphyrinogen decarboxylase
MAVQRPLISETSSLIRVLGGERVDPPPVWLMRQAGRYLPEYRAVRAEAGGFLDLVLDPVRAAEVTLQPLRRYDFDAAILFSDILIVPWALGQGLRFAEGEGPLLPPLDAAGLAALDEARAPARWAPVIATVARLATLLPAHVPLIGFCGSPLTVAAYMLDGKGGGFPRTRAMAASADPMLDAVLALLVRASIAYLRAQLDAGARVVQLFESHGALADATSLERVVLAPNRAIVEALRQSHPQVRIIGFPRGGGSWLGRYAAATGVDGVGIDTATDMAAAAAALPPGVAVQGNLAPETLVAGGPALAAAVRTVRVAAGQRPHVFNLGHGITPDTPTAHVAALVAALRSPT